MSFQAFDQCLGNHIVLYTRPSWSIIRLLDACQLRADLVQLLVEQRRSVLVGVESPSSATDARENSSRNSSQTCSVLSSLNFSIRLNAVRLTPCSPITTLSDRSRRFVGINGTRVLRERTTERASCEHEVVLMNLLRFREVLSYYCRTAYEVSCLLCYALSTCYASL